MIALPHVIRLLPLWIALAMLQFGLQLWATIALVQREKTHGPKWVWVLVIWLFELLGPIVYFIFGPDRNK
jgi:hypothetical protein